MLMLKLEKSELLLALSLVDCECGSILIKDGFHTWLCYSWYIWLQDTKQQEIVQIINNKWDTIIKTYLSKEVCDCIKDIQDTPQAKR